MATSKVKYIVHAAESGKDRQIFPSLEMRRQHWDARSILYEDDVRQAPIRAQALQVLLGLLPSQARLVLDAGTGTGSTAVAIRTKLPDARIIASDISSGMLIQARSQPGADRITWITAHGTRLPFREASFQLATSTFTLHHFPPPEQFAVLCELRRVVDSDGRILLIDQVAPDSNLEQEALDKQILDLFYSHLPVHAAEGRLARFGEWPLTSAGLIRLASQAGLYARHIVVHPLVSVFDLRVSSEDSNKGCGVY